MKTPSLHIDFETRSKVDLKKSGVWRYALDPSTSVLCLGYAIGGGPADIWIPGECAPKELIKIIDAGGLVTSFNVMFERAIWTAIMTPRYKWPLVSHDQWRCSAARVATHALPRQLHLAGEALGLEHKKDMEDRRIMLKLSRPRTPTKNNTAEWHNDPQDFNALYSYCKKDVETEREIETVIKELSQKELQIWKLDQKMNERGIQIDLDFVQAAKKIVDDYALETGKRLASITKGAVEKGTERDRILNWLIQRGVVLETLRKNDVKQTLETQLPEDVKEVLLIRQEMGKISTAKYEAILNSVCPDGRLRDLLMYHGASTGRWTAKGVQPQNFPRDTPKDMEQQIRLIKNAKNLEEYAFLYPDVMKSLSQILRGVFIPTPGYKMFGGDYNAIEARALFWLADEKKGLQMFRDGVDLYVDLAKDIYPGQEIDFYKRDLGKRGILGAGYGMGHKKFQSSSKELFGIDITDEIAERVITTYRSKYHSVQRLWWDLENGAMKACQTGLPVQCGKTLWARVDKFLYCKLPSGRCLAYYLPKIMPTTTPWGAKKTSFTFMGVNSQTGKFERVIAYGGMLAENVTQATARDIMAEAMLRVDFKGYALILSIHDEILAEKTDGNVSEFKLLMEGLADWAEGFPLKAEVWSGARYAK